jgi:hypothetical protein
MKIIDGRAEVAMSCVQGESQRISTSEVLTISQKSDHSFPLFLICWQAYV